MTEKEPNLYSFGWTDEANVPIPELDAFMTALEALCRQYGIGFEMDYIGEGRQLILVTFERADFEVFTSDLDDAPAGIPWLDDARKRYEANLKQIHERERQIRAKEREADERQLYVRLRAKYEKDNP